MFVRKIINAYLIKNKGHRCAPCFSLLCPYTLNFLTCSASDSAIELNSSDALDTF